MRSETIALPICVWALVSFASAVTADQPLSSFSTGGRNIYRLASAELDRQPGAKEIVGSTYGVQVGHGCAPHCEVATVAAILAAAPKTCLGFVSAEDEQLDAVPTGSPAKCSEICTNRLWRWFPPASFVCWMLGASDVCCLRSQGQPHGRAIRRSEESKPMKPIHTYLAFVIGSSWAAGACPRPRQPVIFLAALFLGSFILSQAGAQGIQGLRADPSGHFLLTEEGKPFVWQGDTLWGALSLGPADIDYYLDTRKAQGFNVIQMMAHRNDYAGNPPFAQTDPVSLHEAHWAYIDSIVAKAAARNMYVCLFLMWGQNADTLFPDPPKNNYQYGKLVGQRYATNNAVIFAGSGEYHKIVAPEDWKTLLTPEQVTLIARIGEGLEEGHGGRRPNTMHPNAGGAQHSTGSSSQHFHASPWLDFHMLQTWGDINKARSVISLVNSDYRRTPAKPTLNGEPGYEDRHLHDRPNDGVIDAWHCRVEAYWALFSGACGHTYGNSFVYFASPTWKTALHSTAGDDMRHWQRLLESRPVLIREPCTDLITSSPGSIPGNALREPGDYRLATRAADGSYAFVYSTRGLGFTIDMSRISGSQAEAWWYNPRDGKTYDNSGSATVTPFGAFDTSGTRTFDPPGETGKDQDWVLILDDASRGYGVP